MIGRHGEDLRYCGSWRKWLVYGGGRWQECPTPALVQQRTIRLIREARGDAARESGPEAEAASKALFAAEKRATRDSIVALAAHESAVQIAPEDLDRDPMLFNVRNGTLDLRTGELRPHRREDHLAKIAPVAYDPSATAPRWEAFLEQIFAGNKGLIGFVQKAVGYSLTGDVGEQVFFIAWGGGANGKSTLLGALLAACGAYGWAAGDDLLIAPRGERHPQELAGLFGCRFVVCQETAEGSRLNESRVKRLTGDDPVTAHRMRENDWTFNPTHKLWLCTNHRPVIRAGGVALWRRVRLIPFTVTIPDSDRDRNLPAKLRRELPGILAWAVRGCLAWRRDGLATPPEVTAATEDYRQAEDRLAVFVADCCMTGPGKQATAAELYRAFAEWAEARREYVLTAKAFGEALGERGFEPDRAGKGRERIWRGIGLLTDGRTHADATSSLPHSARTSQTNGELGPHASAPPDREPGEDADELPFDLAGGIR